MPPREYITRAELARRLGCHRSAVSRAIARCGIPVISGKVDFEAAVALWRLRTRPADRDSTLRHGGQNRDQPPAESALVRGSVDDLLAYLIEAAGERLVASLIFECDLDIEKAGCVVHVVGCALDDVLVAHGAVPSRLSCLVGPALYDPTSPARHRVIACVSEIRAECEREGVESFAAGVHTSARVER
jgi:hypothetical protein